MLQNYPWKQFLRESLEAGEVPLWNPRQFSGIPFLAAGQHSGHYTFSLIYYILPLWLAYGWFTVFQLWVAGAGMYAFMRGLRTGRFGSVVAALAWQLSAFLVIGAVFPMILAAVTWLPLLLLLIELLCARPEPGRSTGARAMDGFCCPGPDPCVDGRSRRNDVLHPACRGRLDPGALVAASGRAFGLRDAAAAVPWLLAVALIGMATAALQLLPLVEFAGKNFRSGSASYEQVIGWAHPSARPHPVPAAEFLRQPGPNTAVTDIFNGQQVRCRSLRLNGASRTTSRPRFTAACLPWRWPPWPWAICAVQLPGARRGHSPCFSCC